MNFSRFIVFTLLAMLAATASGQQQPDSAGGVSLRVAAVSFVPQKFDLAGNADRLERAFRRAKEGDAKIAVAPEGALDGYVVNEIIAGDAPAEKIREVAIAIDDPVIQRFQRLARELEMCLVFGFAELVEDDVFNAAVFIDHEGHVCGKYHKMQFAEGYDPTWWFNRLGKTSRAFDTPYGRCGMLICNDRWNPQLAQLPVLDGARFLIIPAFGSRSEAQDQAVLNRGKENRVPVVEANVGVTLVVNDGAITAVDREEEGITFGVIDIPAAADSQPQQRQQLEREFLQWRDEEMKRRLQRTQERLKQQRQQAIEALKKLGARIRFDHQQRVVEVNLQETRTGDDDLVHLKRLKHLQELSLHQTQVTSGGLVHIHGLTKLRRLFLSDTKVGDAGLAQLAELTHLEVLGLSGTKVSDAGLPHLKPLTRLESLFLIDAQTTAAGVGQLQRALPRCDITR